MLPACTLTLCLAASALLQAPAPTATRTADSAEIARLERVWNEAHVRGDVAALDSLWAEELTVTVPEMPVMTKTEVLGVWRSGRATIARYETSPTRLQVYADAAVVEGRLHRSRNFNGRTADDHWRFTKLYVRQGGRWRVVAYHASTVPSR
jgi:ketosteroid isomerase-like protein